MGAVPPGLSARLARAAAAALALAAACADATGSPDDPGARQPERVERVSADTFRVMPGDTTEVEVAVRVVDGRGRPVGGVEVVWEPAHRVAPARGLTDDRGEARARWRPWFGTLARPEALSAVVLTPAGERRVDFTMVGREKAIHWGTVIRADTFPRNTGDVIEVGQAVRFMTYGDDGTGTHLAGLPARWSSRDTTRATVDQSGVVTARAQGPARVDAVVPVANPTPWTTVLVVDPLRAREVAAGRTSSCALLPDGRAACWGTRFTGLAQSRDTIVEPIVPAPALRSVALRASERYVCALTAEGRTHCWGGPFLGGGGFLEGYVRRVGTAFDGLRLATVAPGDGFACGADTAGAVHCTPLVTAARSGTFGGSVVRIALPAPVRALASSGDRACAAAGDEVHCWRVRTALEGTRTFGPAERVAAGVGATELGLSGRRLCVLDTAGHLRCADLDAASPAVAWSAPLGDVALVRLAVGPYTVCGIDVSAALRCAGSNHAGLLMAPPAVDPPAIVDRRAPDGTGWARVSLGDYIGAPSPFADPHACAVTVGGRTYCWGAQSAGQLGSPSEVLCGSREESVPCSPTPLPVPSVTGAAGDGPL